MAHLKGMEAIAKYTNRAIDTVLDWIVRLDFPAKKIGGSSIWESDTELIDEWRKNQISDKSHICFY